MQQQNQSVIKKSIWHQRRRRVVTGVNVVVALLLIGAAVLITNIIASKFPLRWTLSSGSVSGLSDKTISLLNGLETKIEVTAFLPSDSTQASLIRDLLKEYEYAAARKPALEFSVEIVDPIRNIARTRELSREYEIAEDNVVVFNCEGRRKYVGLKEIAEYQLCESEGKAKVEMVAFKGEQAFSSAILRVSHGKTPVIYFLQGHGERSIEDYGRQSGYSGIAKAIRRDNMEIRELRLAETGGVPDDCTVLVVPGPSKQISTLESEMIADFLANRHGRLLLMMDPSVKTGLESLLHDWGVRIGTGIVSGLTLSGQELVVRNYGDHPITHRLGQLMTMFYRPCPVEPSAPDAPANEVSADKARVTMLAMCGKQGWEERNLSQRSVSFDPGTDRPGPISVAVAVEKGTVAVDVEIEPTRLVVIGDSFFVSNTALSSGMGGNTTFFMSALNWLAARESLLAAPPTVPNKLRLDMTRNQILTASAIMVLVIPGIVILCGLMVWRIRRKA